MNESNVKYVLGLDLGIASVGWALLIKDGTGQLKRIENLGVRLFSTLEDEKGNLENQVRRGKRGLRRLRRRKVLRLQETRELFLTQLGIEFKHLPFQLYQNPYELKIKGLHEQLSKEELTIALYHYMKYRGFKSNRKVDDEKSEGVLLNQIKAVDSQLKASQLTITEYLYNQYLSANVSERRIHNVDDARSLFNKKDANKSIRNKDDHYLFSASRAMYLEEMSVLLDKQISFGVISPSFKEKYTQIFARQRSFSMGPGKGSPYAAPEGQTLISKMIGICTFDQNPRAPKAAFSSESFVLLSFLNNLQIKEKPESNYRGLTANEIKSIYQLALKSASLSYNSIFKVINVSVYRVKGLELSRKQFISFMKVYKEENNISTPTLDANQYDDFVSYSKSKLFDSKIVSLANYHAQKKSLDKYGKEHPEVEKEIKDFVSKTGHFDTISEILLNYKVDAEIKQACIKQQFSEAIATAITTLSSNEKTINLSLPIVKNLLPLLLDGNGYDKVMGQLGYNHSSVGTDIEQCKFLPEINECMDLLNESLTNVNVRHTLVEMRKVVNEVIKKYGYIHEIHVEFARELAKSFKDRNDIKNEQLDNQDENIRLKEDLIIKYPNYFHKFSDIRGDTLLKYKLYKEQNHKCAYSNKYISEQELFDSNATQIDHIMPYSRTFENRNFNKVLVFTSYNQEKKNRLPYEAYKGEKWQAILDFINDPNVHISDKKKETLLLRELDDKEWLQRNLNDTKYIAVLAKKLIESFLKPEKCRAIPGAITDKVKHSYGLTNLTHSYLKPNYRKNEHYFLNPQATEVSSNSIKFSVNSDLQDERIVEVKMVKQVGKMPLSYRDIAVNDAIQYFVANQSFLFTQLGENKVDFDLFVEDIAIKMSKTHDPNQSNLFEHLIILLGEVKQELVKISNDKDRSNHLHHALDAVVIACTDDKMTYRIQNYEKLKKVLYDEETGEELSTTKFDPPYPEFYKEVLYRIYERDYQTMISKLSKLDNYQGYHFKQDDCYVFYPSRATNKNITGPLTKDTILGFNEHLNVITKRISVHDISDKNIESILYKDNGSKAQYEAIKKWMQEGKPTQFPVLPGKGNYIKKVVLIESEDPRKRVQLREKAFAENAEVIRVDVYQKKEDDGKLYFVPIFYYQIEREKRLEKGHKIQSVLYEMMWAQGDKREFLTSIQLQNEFIKLLSLPRYSLIEIELKNGSKGLCYSAGASSGFFEIYSILGDNQDLLNSQLFNKINNRYQLTVSTIKSIKLHNISILGKIY